MEDVEHDASPEESLWDRTEESLGEKRKEVRVTNAARFCAPGAAAAFFNTPPV
jgi:hypothetical protein